MPNIVIINQYGGNIHESISESRGSNQKPQQEGNNKNHAKKNPPIVTKTTHRMKGQDIMEEGMN